MAKPRKPKSEEPKPENSGAVVRHQKLCLSIDIPKRQIYGYTELEIAVPEIGIVGLHAENIGIESVFVDGEPAEFEYYPYYAVEGESRWREAVTCPSSAADAAAAAYIAALERELVPNLLVNCCKAFRAVPSEQMMQDGADLENGAQSSGEAKQNVKLLRVNYWIEKAASGIHIDDNVLHTDNQIRRARCWFPSIDGDLQSCCYDLEFTVAHDLVAVSSGTLLYQVLSKDDPPRKSFVYRLEVPVNPQWISLVVGPFEIFPDPHVGFISHMCLPANLSKLQNTVEFFHVAFKHYEEYLGSKFPFGSYTQVFLAPEMAVSSLTLGASISILSSQLLYDEKVIDQAIDTSIKLAFALAKQWFGVYITPEEPNDEWLLDGLAAFLTDLFIKKFLGNNEARYRRYKANCAVCKADETGATVLSSFSSCKNLYGTHCIGIYGKIRAWKAVVVLQMLEKQMGPESFRKILQQVVSRAQDVVPIRSLSTKEFRHFATKVGNLERPFVKEFFPRWVCSCGCPVLRMGFSYNKRRNMVELAVLRECTTVPEASTFVLNPDSENRDADTGWPGMMSIRVHELDGMYDHPVLPLAGEMWQLLEIPCHSKLAARRLIKPKKGSKPDGPDDNDLVPSADMRSNLESPLSWIRADPEMEYLADIHFNQPVQMWINQLEKDGDVVAQAQAIAALEALPQLSFSVVNALNNFLSDSKAFWRVRIEAAFALANTASEETDWAGLLHLVKFYKGRRFDATIGLPKPNDFHDFQEYFVLEAIPHAVAMVRASDNRSPREAIEFVLQLLKYNDNTGNPYSDVFWLAALVQAAGALEFGQQSILYLSSLLKRIDRLLQFDRLLPSYNGVLTSSCIRALTQITLKLSGSVHLQEHVLELIKPFQRHNPIWQVRIEARRALLDLEFHFKGIDAAMALFITYLKEEASLRGQVKLGVHAMRLCQLQVESETKNVIGAETLVALHGLLESSLGFNNIVLRHYLFCVLQILAGREPTLYGVPRERTSSLNNLETCSEPKSIFTALDTKVMPVEPSVCIEETPQDKSATLVALNEADIMSFPEACMEVETIQENHQDQMHWPSLEDEKADVVSFDQSNMNLASSEYPKIDTSGNDESKMYLASYEHHNVQTVSGNDQSKMHLASPENPKVDTVSVSDQPKMDLVVPELLKEADTVSNSHERKMPIVKIRVKQSAASSRVEETDNRTIERSQCGNPEVSRRASSSVSVDAPQRNSTEAMTASNHLEEVNSCLNHGSQMTASIGSAKLTSDGDNARELQCTAESSKVCPRQATDLSSPLHLQDSVVDVDALKFASLKTLSAREGTFSSATVSVQEKEKSKDKEKKQKRDHKSHRHDPEYLEKKRLKKEKKQKKKEIAKLLSDDTNARSLELKDDKEQPAIKLIVQPKRDEPAVSTVVSATETKPSENAPAPRFRIKIKNKMLSKS